MDLIKDNISILFIYALLTCFLVWGAFSAGKDIGYDKGVASTLSIEYVSGVADGVDICIEAVFDRMERSVLKRHVEQVDI